MFWGRSDHLSFQRSPDESIICCCWYDLCLLQLFGVLTSYNMFFRAITLSFRSFDIRWFPQFFQDFLAGWAFKVSSDWADWENSFMNHIMKPWPNLEMFIYFWHLPGLNTNWEMHWEENVGWERRKQLKPQKQNRNWSVTSVWQLNK